MPTLLLARLLSLVLAFASTAGLAAGMPPWQGHWSGTLTFRGDTWPVRLALPASLEAATIDLPALWMAWEPLAASAEADVLTVELPFGLGAVELSPCEAGLCGSSALGTDTLAVALHPEPPLDIARSPVTLHSGVATLHGEFLVPRGSSLPAVVLVHGSGNNTRADWNYRSAADFWLRHGHAVLLYDKRGSGESDGEWMTTSFPDLADLGGDLQAALAWVAQQPGVDEGRIGVHGGSQALWTVAIATQLGARPDFAVISGAPATTPLVQERDSVHRRLQGADLSPDELDAARRHVDLYFRAAADPAHAEAAIASSRVAAGTAWESLVPLAATDDDFFWWRRNHAVDPGTALRAWEMPVLVLQGEADAVVTPDLHLPRIRGLIDPARLTVATFPGAAHNLELPGGRDDTGQWRFPRRHPDVAGVIEDWLPVRAAMLAPPDASPAPR